jgi:hypothetical protein
MPTKNLKLKAELTSLGYTLDDFVKIIKNDCKIKSKASLSKRINGVVPFTQDEIIVICKTLKKSPIEIFFTNWLLVG